MASGDRGRAAASFELRMAVRYLTTRRREGAIAAVTLLCTGGVFVGVAALVLALALMAGVQGDVRERLLSSNPHVVVRGGFGEPLLSAERAEEIIAQVAALPGVVGASPLARENALLTSRLAPRGRPAEIAGIDPAREDAVTGLRAKTSPGAWAALSAAPAQAPSPLPSDEEAPLSAADLAPPELPPLVLGEGLSLDLGVVPGDVVHVLTLTPELTALGPAPRSRAFRVAGLVRTGLHEYDQAWAVTRIDALRPGGSGVDAVEVALGDPLDARRFSDRLQDVLADDCQVTDWTRTFARLFAAFKWERLIMALFLGLIGLVAGFNIFTILTLNVMARTADIGVLSALGARPAAIARVFAWMGLGLGGLGTLAGLATGAAAAWILDRFELVRLDPAVYLVSHVSFRVLAQDLAVVGAGMLLVSLVATLLPARSAARLDPLVALRRS